LQLIKTNILNNNHTKLHLQGTTHSHFFACPVRWRLMSERPDPAIVPPIKMLRSQPAKRAFAAGAKPTH
jgi:hypothetical protein